MTLQEREPMLLRNRILLFVVLLAASVLVAGLLLRLVGETGGTNAYAVVAESFLTGTPWASTCLGADCASVDGKTYIIFPPAPGVLAIPLVWLNGIKTTGFAVISLLLAGGALVLWNRMFRAWGVACQARLWLLLALAFASPLYYVTLRADGVWFFAQSLGFFCVTLALHEGLVGRRLVTAGLALGVAFLSRQMSIFYAPLILLLWLQPGEPLLRIDRARLRAVLAFGAPLCGAVLCYFAYNDWRFGSITETGYRFMAVTPDNFLGSRITELGLWNKSYVVYNFFYAFIQGFHANFAGMQQLGLSGLDPAGTSILAASPWLLLLFFAKADRRTVFCLALIAGLSTAFLFYHSNGFSQYNTQRYALDWLPAALVILAPSLTTGRLVCFRLLVAWGVFLNVAMLIVLKLAAGAA